MKKSTAPTNQMHLLANLLQYLAEHSDWRTVGENEADAMREGWPVTAWHNVIWYAVREGYCRPNHNEPCWRETLNRMERGIRLSSIIPSALEAWLGKNATELMILPRGELRLHQIKKEFDL